MNATIIMQILATLPALVQSIESLFGEQAKGPEKLNAVLQAILVMVPREKVDEFMQQTWPKIAAYVTVLVKFYNVVGFFKSLATERKSS